MCLCMQVGFGGHGARGSNSQPEGAFGFGAEPVQLLVTASDMDTVSNLCRCEYCCSRSSLSSLLGGV
jgi:hypothetical protein